MSSTFVSASVLTAVACRPGDLVVMNPQLRVQLGVELALFLALGHGELQAMVAHEDPQVVHGGSVILVEIDEGQLELVSLEHLDNRVELSQGRPALEVSWIAGMKPPDLFKPV